MKINFQVQNLKTSQVLFLNLKSKLASPNDGLGRRLIPKKYHNLYIMQTMKQI